MSRMFSSYLFQKNVRAQSSSRNSGPIINCDAQTPGPKPSEIHTCKAREIGLHNTVQLQHSLSTSELGTAWWCNNNGSHGEVMASLKEGGRGGRQQLLHLEILEHWCHRARGPQLTQQPVLKHRFSTGNFKTALYHLVWESQWKLAWSGYNSKPDTAISSTEPYSILNLLHVS